MYKIGTLVHFKGNQRERACFGIVNRVHKEWVEVVWPFPDDSGESTTMFSLDADGVVQLCVNNVSFIGVGYDFPERTIDSL